MTSTSGDVARGPGPPWFRVALVVVALLYYLGLIDHPRSVSVFRPIAFFTQSTCLFPSADEYELEYHLEAWSCGERRWRAFDPRPYFPMHADDKESRFQRIAYFYEKSRPTFQALERFLERRHGAALADGTADDGVRGPIGGIRIARWQVPLPDPGDDVARYDFDPMMPILGAKRDEIYETRPTRRACTCKNDAKSWLDQASCWVGQE